MKNRWIALLLALVLTIGMLPTAFAAESAELSDQEQMRRAAEMPETKKRPEFLGAYTDEDVLPEEAAEDLPADALAVQAMDEELPALPELSLEELEQALTARLVREQTSEDEEEPKSSEDIAVYGNNGNYTGPGGKVSSASKFAKAVGGSYYATVSGNTVTLLRNVVPQQTITMSGNFTVDLNGHQLFNDDFIGDDYMYALLISKSGKQTLIDSKYSVKGSSGGYYGALCTQGGTIEARSCYIMDTEVGAGSFVAVNAAIAHPGNSTGTTTMTNCAFLLAYVFGGTVDMTNCFSPFYEDDHRCLWITGGRTTLRGKDTQMDGWIGMKGETGELTIEDGIFGHEDMPWIFAGKGKLTINGGNFINSLNISSGSEGVNATTNVTVNGGNFYAQDSSGVALVQWGGSMTINGGKWYSSNEDDDDAEDETPLRGRCLRVGTGKLTIKNGLFDGKLQVLDGTVTIEDGFFYADEGAIVYQDGGLLTVNGGTWTANVEADEDDAVISHEAMWANGGTLRICGGEIDGAVNALNGARLEITKGEIRSAGSGAVYVSGASAAISGGTIFGCPEVLIACDGADVTVSGGELISSGDYYLDNPGECAPAVFLYQGAKFTLTDGTITNGVDGIFAKENSASTVTITGGTVEAERYALDLWYGNTVRLTGGTFTADENVIWSPQNTLSGWIPDGYVLSGDCVPEDFDPKTDWCLGAGTVTVERVMTAAEKVEALIDEIGTVTLDSEQAIVRAEEAYNALSSSQKQQVKNYSKLTAARQAYNALVQERDKDKTIAEIVELLEALPDSNNVWKDDQEAIEEANDAYTNAISDVKTYISKNYKQLVKNLTACIKALDKNRKAAEKVEQMIQKLPECLDDITLSDEKGIKAADKAYQKLTAAQKSFVGDDYAWYPEASMARLSVLLECKQQIEAVEKLIKKLPAASKIKASDEEKLLEARERVDALEAGNLPIDETLLQKLEESEKAFEDGMALTQELREMLEDLDPEKMDKIAGERYELAQEKYDEDKKLSQRFTTKEEQNVLKNCKSALKKNQSAAGKVEKQIEKLPDPDKLTAKNEKAVQKAYDAYEKLTDAQKTFVDDVLYQKLLDCAAQF